MKLTSKRRSNTSREYRLPANVMHEEAWEDDGPNMKLARAFIVVLVLHIVAVAGLAAFNLFDDGSDKIGNNTQLPGQDTPPAETAATPQVPGKQEAGTPGARIVMEGMRAVKVDKQMSTALFAREYGLKEEELLEMNKHTPLVSGPLFPDETVYVPDAAEKRSAIEDLPVAPVVIPSVVAKTTPPTTDRVVSPPAVDPAPSRQAPPAETPKATPTRTPEPKPVAKATPKPEPTPASSPGTHTVRRGENLFRISQKYGVSVQALQRANGIKDAAVLLEGQVLKVPK